MTSALKIRELTSQTVLPQLEAYCWNYGGLCGSSSNDTQHTILLLHNFEPLAPSEDLTDHNLLKAIEVSFSVSSLDNSQPLTKPHSSWRVLIHQLPPESDGNQ